MVHSTNLTRLVMLLLATSVTVAAEFRRIEVTFQDMGCASCVASLEGRLARVRGVERVQLDAKRGVVVLDLEAGNRVRLQPMLSRISQDGTKITAVEVLVRGTLEPKHEGFLFHPIGLPKPYWLEAGEWAARMQPAILYELRGAVTGTEPGAALKLTPQSIEVAAPAAE